MHARPRVIIVGGGFGGLSAARALHSAAVDVLLIDRGNHHTFQPLLYQVATAGLAAPSIAAPLRQILRDQRNATVLLGEARTVDIAGRSVDVDGVSYPYDNLVVAAGSTHAYFGHDDWARYAPGLKTLEDALHIRARVLTAFERAEATADPAERTEWLTFPIVGAGATGVELAGTLAEIARHTLKREFRHIDPATAKILLVEAGPRVLPSFPPSLSAKARRQLERLGVIVRTGQPVTQLDERGVCIGDERIGARTVLWAAGVAASPLGVTLGVGVDRAGRVPVTAELGVPGHPEVFVVGDLAAVPDGSGPIPAIAPAAKQMGHYAAAAILARLSGRRIGPFRYRHFGSLATIGRMAAVADFGRVRLSGILAWWIWLTAHIFFLIGFRNRLVVLIDWAEAYWSYRRGARIIIPVGEPWKR
ncbi:MAG TPA: NAD(P)/FAD-dependent oxidoreductase [Steroidobacteraceae bacterium]|jgi:NADH dehydrogenase|nr:NAD(P)/FAD-dependent oxidoreductase [Steroidobacteraceae bacterium]